MTNFDRAADFYDETRALPPAQMELFLQRLRDQLGGARSVLEVGVGTGRVAVPLAQGGLHVTGVDISERMLAVLRAKRSPVDAQVADATDLPFATDRFDAGLAVHVLHLIPAWQEAVAELVRVVRPGGRIISPWFVPDVDPLQDWQQAGRRRCTRDPAARRSVARGRRPPAAPATRLPHRRRRTDQRHPHHDAARPDPRL
ncbi:MAG TPA: class I SAM-dependent methyltransferase [Euzebya sp.]|nr:class I SAM-dependent methyltransferase [Euzebya sp.]